MSRSKNKKKKGRQKRKKVLEKPRFMTRRKFLAGLTAGALALGGWKGYNVFSEDRWSFLNREKDPIQSKIKRGLSIEEVGRYVPFGPNVNEQVSNLSRLGENPLKILGQLKLKGMQEGWESVGNRIVARYVGVPDNPDCTEDLVRYCREANEFLSEHPELGALDVPQIDWTPIKNGEDYSEDYEDKAFVGHSYIGTYTFQAFNERNPAEIISYPLYEHMSGGRVFQWTSRETGKSIWFIYVSGNEPETALLAPFSELIPASSRKSTQTLLDKFGREETEMVAEAFSESLSRKLAIEFAESFEIPDGKMIIEGALEKMMKFKQYAALPASIDYLEKKGVEETVKLYVEDPLKYREEIRSSVIRSLFSR